MHTSAAGEGGSGQPAGRPVPKSARAWGLGTGRMRPCTRVQASGAQWLALAALACCVTGASSFASGAAAAFARAAVRLQLMETWTRKYQVADQRTHPEMNAYPATGYVLSGVAVLR